jgi:hypothetical protein
MGNLFAYCIAKVKMAEPPTVPMTHDSQMMVFSQL